MGFSGSKIHGHSGTAHKPRKPFFKTKKYINVTKGARIAKASYNNQPAKIVPQKPYKESKFDEFLKFGVKLPLFILGSCALFLIGRYLFFSVTTELNNYQSNIAAANIAEFNDEKINAYQVLVKDGFRYLELGAYELAQTEFTFALQLYNEGQRARVGLYTALSQQCILEDRYCEEAAENLRYLKHMNYVGNTR